MDKVSAYAAVSATEPLCKTTISRRDPGPYDVAIDIRFAGICHSDIHVARAEWGPTNYPMVPGHEIAGVVAEVGARVTKYQKGDRVGVGLIADSCRECRSCRNGLEQYCTIGLTPTINSIGRDGQPTQGGYSESIVIDERYVVRIPESLALEKAAPLMCAGITLYSPLRHWNVGSGTRLAVVGLGGLGHMGVKLAAAMGAEVTVLSQSLRKMEDGLRLGAERYYATADPDTFRTLRGSFDVIINTVSAKLDLGAYLGLLDIDGTLVELGIPEHSLEVPAGALLAGRRTLSGSQVGSIAETREMLDFCAEHDVTPDIELIEPDYINRAYERVLASDVRYRFVIDISKL